MTKRRVLMEGDATLPLLSVAVSTLSGAAGERGEVAGVTRVTGRLMRRTAGHRSPSELDRVLESLGATLGYECSYDTTSLTGVALARNAREYLDVLAGAILSPGLDQEELQRLVKETDAEIVESLDNDQELAQRWFWRSLFAQDAYGGSIVGSRQSIARIAHDDVVEANRRHFAAGNLIYSFAGTLDEAQLFQFVERVEAGLQQRATPSALSGAALSGEPVSPEGRHLVFVDKPERTQTQILMGCLGSHPSDPDHAALQVANTAFGGTFSARLSQEVRAKRGWSYGAYSSLSHERRRQAFSMWTFPRAEDAASCIELQLSMYDDWLRNGLTADELERARRYLVQSFAFARDTAAKRLGLRAEEALLGLPEGYYAEYVPRIAAVTLEQANAAVQQRLTQQNLVICVVGTHRDIGDSVQSAVGALASERLVAFDDV